MQFPHMTLLLCALLLSGCGGDAVIPTEAGDGKVSTPSGEPRLNTYPYASIEGYSVVAPYEQCLYIAAHNGVPVDFKWTVTGATGQANGPYWRGSSTGPSFQLAVEITLDDGRKAYAFKDVTVDPWAGQCTDY